VVIVGRPNVGKSTLFNRLTRTRRALVGDEPGITRDRLLGVAEWRGHQFQLTDTGGLLPGSREEIPAAIFQQARLALASAAVVIMLVDGRTELAAPDLELARLLCSSGKPVLLLVNKIESERQAGDLGPFYRLGMRDVFPISAEHGQGLEAALEAVLAALEAAGEPSAEAQGSAAAEPAQKETRIAIVGRPNVGKSTLLNRLLGEARAIVSPVAGTTRDAVDAVLQRGNRRWRIVDTAGIRRKGVTRLMAEKLSVVMARKHLEQADVALIVLDAAEPEEGGVLSLDATIAGYAVEALRSCLIVVNKWDRARALGRSQEEYKRRVRERLKFLAFAPIVFISAQEGTGMPKLEAAIGRVARERHKRVPTAALNRFLATVDFTRAPTPLGQRVRILYLSQVSTAPPQFVLFLDRARPLHFAYRRFLENQLRQAFGFEGTPLLLKTRIGKQTPARGR
jgi:GTP-binding protein